MWNNFVPPPATIWKSWFPKDTFSGTLCMKDCAPESKEKSSALLLCTSNLFALFIFHWPVWTLLCTAKCRLCALQMVRKYWGTAPINLFILVSVVFLLRPPAVLCAEPINLFIGGKVFCTVVLGIYMYNVHLYNNIEVTQCSKTIHWRHFNCSLFCATRCEPSRVMHWSLWWFYFVLNFCILRSSYSTFECAYLHYHLVGFASWFLKTGCSLAVCSLVVYC